MNCSKIMSEKVHFTLGDKLPTVYDAAIAFSVATQPRPIKCKWLC